MPNPYPDGNSTKSKKTKQLFFDWEWNVAQPAQENGYGWTVNKLMGGLGRTLTPRQKQLRGKTVKPITISSIKGPWLYTVEGEANTRDNKEK